MPLLEVTGLSKRFGGFVALDEIDLAVAEGERVGLIGPNGSGKSTLVNCICGTLVNETGMVRFAGEKIDGLLTHERTRRGLARNVRRTSMMWPCRFGASRRVRTSSSGNVKRAMASFAAAISAALICAKSFFCRISRSETVSLASTSTSDLLWSLSLRPENSAS